MFYLFQIVKSIMSSITFKETLEKVQFSFRFLSGNYFQMVTVACKLYIGYYYSLSMVLFALCHQYF